MGVLLFILGLVAGGMVSFFLAGVLSSRRISQYEIINEKLRRQNERLADSLPEKERENIFGSDRCVCCGEPIPEGHMVCSNCLRESCDPKPVNQAIYLLFGGSHFREEVGTVFLWKENEIAHNEKRRYHSAVSPFLWLSQMVFACSSSSSMNLS